MNESKGYVKGLALSVFIAAISFLLSNFHPALDSLVVSILFGIILGNLLRDREGIEAGISLSARVFIPLGITLYGSQLFFYNHLPYYRYIEIISLMAVYFIVIVVLSKILRISRNTALLLASGSAICGASAIVVLSPVISARKEETSISLISITIVGLTGVIFYPVIQGWFSIPLDSYAFLCGTTLPQIGMVKLASSALGVFKEAFELKLVRVAMLAPIAVLLTLPRRRTGEKGGYFIPWFILTMVMTAILFNMIPSLRELSTKIEQVVRFIFSIAIAGIGLSIDLDAVIEEGIRPLLITFLGWFGAVGALIVFSFFIR